MSGQAPEFIQQVVAAEEERLQNRLGTLRNQGTKRARAVAAPPAGPRPRTLSRPDGAGQLAAVIERIDRLELRLESLREDFNQTMARIADILDQPPRKE